MQVSTSQLSAMQSKQWIVLAIVLGLALLGNCQGKGKNKNKDNDKDKKIDIRKNLCKNVTLAVEELKLNVTDERFNVIFKNRGERVCNSTVKKLTKLPRKLKRLGIKSNVHVDNCKHRVKLIASTLNPKGLEWVCSQRKIKSVTHDPAPPVRPQTEGDEHDPLPFLG